MTFRDWLAQIGLSESSIQKYSGALNGAISEWAIQNGILFGPFCSLNNKSTFDKKAEEISALPIFIERNKRGNNMYSSALNKYSTYLEAGFENDVESDIDQIISDASTTATEKTSLIKSRVGQGIFRQKLIGYWGSCAVTKMKDTNFLIASHIKPWRSSANDERLDVFNGLLLTPNLDRAFDNGFITFDKNGYILISPQLTKPEQLGINSNLHIQLAEGHEKYMTFHRNFVFRTN
ncbi:HNH endonuclease [Jeongeupia sp. USM3]|uniref:HNH endonuclease n=1 Tax=Jeongeupia sp. USM3 TaxID=1906741 RepID=UPI0009F6E7A1|nr:HNH endonuclease [Jeongeupia sp. USM3]